MAKTAYSQSNRKLNCLVPFASSCKDLCSERHFVVLPSWIRPSSQRLSQKQRASPLGCVRWAPYRCSRRQRHSIRGSSTFGPCYRGFVLGLATLYSRLASAYRFANRHLEPSSFRRVYYPKDRTYRLSPHTAPSLLARGLELSSAQPSWVTPSGSSGYQSFFHR